MDRALASVDGAQPGHACTPRRRWWFRSHRTRWRTTRFERSHRHEGLATATRRRLDAELLRRGLASSREQAQIDIEAGRITVGGAPVFKPTRLVQPGDAIVVLAPAPRFVSRAGDKLDGALDRIGLDVTGLRALDAGASTGGFTDCLLQRGAAEVVSVDVGYGLLHERLLADGRVRSLDRTNIRDLDLDAAGAPFDLVTGDLSFISLRSVTRVLVEAARAGAPIVILAKPQFEATKLEADRGRGVITDPAIWHRVLLEVIGSFASAGATIMGVMVSTVRGPDGNVEFVLHLQRGAPSPGAADAESLVETAIAAVGPDRER